MFDSSMNRCDKALLRLFDYIDLYTYVSYSYWPSISYMIHAGVCERVRSSCGQPGIRLDQYLHAGDAGGASSTGAGG